MVVLRGNLGQRQKQLNTIVNEAASRYDNFEDIKNMSETSDIEKFIKIDLASKHRNIDYIIEVIKSGDSLHITRALKYSWIYDVMYIKKMDAEFVQDNIFPFMSLKMKRKLLTFMALNIKDYDRIVNFIKCCMENQLPNLALKFVVNAHNEIKMEFLRKNSAIIEKVQSKTYLQHFIGNSFTLAETLLKLCSEANKIKVLYNIRHMYSFEDVGYLDILERHVKCTPFTNLFRLGSVISRHIIKDHKLRVIANPKIYINLLHMKTVERYITPEDAKIILSELHPEKVEQYWNECFCLFYSSIINKIPYADRFQLLKSMFNLRYKCQPFENNCEFYYKQCYKFMTEEEKLDWIRDQIKNHPEMYSKRYYLYSILAFEGAFKEITNLVKRCDSSETRCDMMLHVLPTVKNQFHIKSLLDYYKDTKEPEHAQEEFINRLLQEHGGYYFNKDCWTILNEIFKKLKVYEFSSDDNALIKKFRVVAILYYIINENDVSGELKSLMSGSEYINELLTLSRKAHLADQQKVYQCLFNYYLGKISEFDTEQRVPELLQNYVTGMLDLLSFYGKTKDDIPEVVKDVIENDRSNLKTHKLINVPFVEVTQKEIMKLLKDDPKLAVNKLPSIIKTHELSTTTVRVSQLFKKLKVYFFTDISNQYVEFYKKWLFKESLSKLCTEAATNAIFLLSDDAYKVHFMTMYVPTDDKKAKIDLKKQRIQHAICATVLNSRPPVPLKHILMYIKGQYIRSCLHLITSYLVNLPLPLCIEFIQELLKTRSFAQEHGLRVTFTCFSAENLRKIILYIWKKNNNASLRLILYTTLYNKICNERECAQAKLFDVLIELTRDINKDDNDIFKIIVSGCFPETLISEFLNVAWIAANSLPRDTINTYKRAEVIQHMCRNFYLMHQDHVRPIIEDFIEDLFDTLQERPTVIHDAIFYLYNKKWELTGKYITRVRNENDFNTKSECARLITHECLKLFNVREGNRCTGRDLFMRFIRFLQSESYTQPFMCYTYINELFDTIIDTLTAEVPMEQIYFMVWDICVDTAVRKAVINIQIHCDNKSMNFNALIKKLKDALIHFGTNIGDIIKKLLENDSYHTNLTTIAVNNAIPHIKRIVGLVDGVKLDDILVASSLGLIPFKTPEHYMFALLFIPEHYFGCYLADYDKILLEIGDCTNVDVIALVFQKFVNTEFKPTDLIRL